MTCCSSSVAAGLVAHDMPCTPSPARDQVAEHRRAGGVGREVGEEAGVLPVREAGQRRPGRGRQHGGERLALLGRRGRQRARAPRRGRPASAPAATRPGSSSRRSSRRPRGRAGGTARESCAEQARSHRTPYSARRAGPGGVPRGRAGARAEDAGTRAAPRGGARSGARRVPRRAPGRAQRSRGTARGGGVVRRTTDQHSAPGATRTHTARVLNPLPLPIGVRGRAGSPGGCPSSLAGRWRDARRR